MSTVTPDVAEKLPGRGVWIKADRLVLEDAVKKKAFARAFKTSVTVPEGLPDTVEALLVLFRKEAELVQQTLPVELVVRESTGPVRTAS